MTTKGLYLRLTRIFGKKAIVTHLRKQSLKSRQAALRAHENQMWVEWHVPPEPEWVDHYDDAYYRWPAGGPTYWMERGIFGLLCIEASAKLLELCCGDGFNAKHFYGQRAASIVAVDFDPDVIEHANTYNADSKVEFRICDIRTQFPEGQFDNIVWDAGIEHFTPEEIDNILKSIKSRLTPPGILIGHTIVERAGGKQLSHHEYEFKDKADLQRFFMPYFKNVRVFETLYPDRHNLYFWASDGVIPFDRAWSGQTSTETQGAAS